MKMETPFKGALAVLGVRGGAGHLMSLRGTWTLAAGAVVYHRPLGLTGGLGETVIGHITGLHAWAGTLYATGMGAEFLKQVLDGGTHALSMEMRGVQTEALGSDTKLITTGQVRAALLVKASDFGWSKRLEQEKEVGL